MEDGGTVRVAVSQVLHRPVLVALFFCQPLGRCRHLAWCLWGLTTSECVRFGFQRLPLVPNGW